MHVVGITGRAGSGKDTVADWLVSHRGFTKIALADPMKEFCRQVFGWSTNTLWGPSALRNAPDSRWQGLTPRRALQQLGTEWGRAMHQDVWIRYALDRAYAIDSPVVVSDIRFDNEVNCIQQAGGLVLQVLRPGGERMDHVSEAGVERADKAIVNDGSLLDLYTALDAIFPITPAPSS